MISHIQTDAQGAFLKFIKAGEPVEWDANNYCTAFALEADGKAEQFGVHPFYAAAQPAYDPITQTVAEANPVLTDGLWTQQWAVVDLSPEQVATNQAEQAAMAREVAKAARAVAVNGITVTTAAGNTFDGDETSQTRMARAILVLSTGAAAAVPWVLADNTVITADIAELTEALALAGAEQARLWVL